MAATQFQAEILKRLARLRIDGGETYIAGGLARNHALEAPRLSHDIDYTTCSYDVRDVAPFIKSQTTLDELNHTWPVRYRSFFDISFTELNSFLAAYNSWGWAFLVCQKESHRTLAVSMYQMSQQFAGQPWCHPRNAVLVRGVAVFDGTADPHLASRTVAQDGPYRTRPLRARARPRLEQLRTSAARARPHRREGPSDAGRVAGPRRSARLPADPMIDNRKECKGRTTCSRTY